MKCTCKNCGQTFKCATYGGNVKKFCKASCRKSFHDNDGRRMTTTATTNPTTENVSKSIGNSIANRALRPAMTVLGAATGLGVVGSVGAGVAADVMTPMVKNGINSGVIKPVGSSLGAAIGFILSKDSQVCNSSINGVTTNCRPNNAMKVGATIAGGLLGNWIETKIRNMLSSRMTTTATTNPTTENIAIEQPTTEGINIDELMKTIFQTYNFSGEFWGLVLGERVDNPFNVIAYGSPGGGKTTMSLKFADFFGRKFGKVKYISSEMGISDGLKSMVKRVNMTSKKVFFDDSKKPLNELINELKTNRFKMLIIDSANYIGYSPEDIETIKNEVKGLSTFIILQSTKDGNFRGANDYAHNADVILKVSDLEVFTEKTRFAAKNVAGMPIN